MAEVVLTLKAAGIDDIYNFPGLEKPEPKALERAETLLEDLGAVAAVYDRPGTTDGGHRPPEITEVGRRMLQFPMHPRYARMFLAAAGVRLRAVHRA